MEQAYDLVAALLGERIGLRVDGSTRARMRRVLRECAARSGRPLDTYAASLARDPGELERVVERVTVQETSFFRHPEQFTAIARHVLRGGPEPGVIWSAGCATGQEAWSLAMLLQEVGAARWSILATDVSKRSLHRAEAGEYAERELRGLDQARRARFLVPAGGGRWAIAGPLRERVRFALHNLVAEPPPGDALKYPLVLCRNVLIYLRAADRARFLAGLRARMPADGVLVVGAAETVAVDDPCFAVQRVEDTFLYRPRDGRPVEAPPWPPAARRLDHAARPQRRLAARPARTSPVPLPSVAELAAAGERHAAAGEHGEAAAAFRKAAYLAPDDALAHVRLGLALERAGDGPAAVRAFRAARAALERDDRDRVEGELAGWSVSELERLLEVKLSR